LTCASTIHKYEMHLHLVGRIFSTQMSLLKYKIIEFWKTFAALR